MRTILSDASKLSPVAHIDRSDKATDWLTTVVAADPHNKKTMIHGCLVQDYLFIVSTREG